MVFLLGKAGGTTSAPCPKFIDKNNNKGLRPYFAYQNSVQRGLRSARKFKRTRIRSTLCYGILEIFQLMYIVIGRWKAFGLHGHITLGQMNFSLGIDAWIKRGR